VRWWIARTINQRRCWWMVRNRDTFTTYYRFVQEAARKIGAQFYNVISDEIEDIDQFFIQHTYGSMMPFSSGLKTTFQPEATQVIMLHVEDHPTVKSWSIQANGQVQIRSVGILAFVNTQGDFTLNCDGGVYFTMISGSHAEDKSLEDLLHNSSQSCQQSSPTKLRRFVVSEQGRRDALCILLQGETVNLGQGGLQNRVCTLPLKLAKTAVLHSDIFLELPAATEVDWIIL
jgi:hypothetical protein